MDKATLSEGITDKTMGVTRHIVPAEKEMLSGERGSCTF